MPLKRNQKWWNYNTKCVCKIDVIGHGATKGVAPLFSLLFLETYSTKWSE